MARAHVDHGVEILGGDDGFQPVDLCSQKIRAKAGRESAAEWLETRKDGVMNWHYFN